MPVTSKKFKEAESALPEDLRPTFQRLAEEYKFLTELEYGKGYIAYKVLANLILAGWRPTGERHKNSKV